jgi:ribosomal-protein-alanine N-acetyltransferase
MTAALRIEPAGLAHARVLTALHAACFDDAWSVGAMADVLASPGAFACLALPDSVEEPAPLGFALARIAADEAELLSLGVIPAARRRRIGQALLDDVVRYAGERGAGTLFLEVAETNEAARLLYAANGPTITSVRTPCLSRLSRCAVCCATRHRSTSHQIIVDAHNRNRKPP